MAFQLNSMRSGFVAKLLVAFGLLGLASASAQLLYETDDTGGGVIFTFTSAGVQNTFASGLAHPEGLAFDAAGNLYVSEFNSNDILKFTPAGVQSTFASGLHGPEGLAFDAAGNLYVATQGNGNPGDGKIIKVTPAGVESIFADGLNRAYGLAFDAAGNLYEADNGSGNIFKFTPAGVQSTFASGLSAPEGLAFDAADNLYEADAGSGTIFKLTPAGVQSTFASGLDHPHGLAFDATGNLYEADNGSSGNIFKFTPAGVKSTFTSPAAPHFLAFAPSFLFETRYFSNLSFADSYIDLTNDGLTLTTDGSGASTENICANVYAFDANEELVACCTCPITPNGLKSLSVKNDLVSNTLTPGVPLAVTVEIIATSPVLQLGAKGQTLTSGCDATIAPVFPPAGASMTKPAFSLHAWGSTPHLNTSSGSYNLGETEFSRGFLGNTELGNLTATCGFINSVGSGFGICKSCQVAGLGAAER